MDMNEVCQEIRAMLPAHAVGALEPGERAHVQAHLEACPDCARELRGYEQVAEGLLHVVSAKTPPAVLRERIASLAERTQERRSARGEGRRPLTVLRPAIVVGLLTLLVVNVVLLIQVQGLAGRQAELQAALERNQTGLALASYPASQVAQLESDRVFGTVVFDPQRSLALLYVWGLEDLPPDQIYQVWLREESGDRTSGGLFRPDPDSRFTVALVESSQPLGTFTGMGATVEPAEGSAGPSGPPVFTASLR